MQLKEIKIIFHEELIGIYPKEEIDSFFHMFMEHYLNMERFALVLHPNHVISKEAEQSFFEGLSRLKKEEPIQYILGETHFMDLRFKVDPSVLIPRPETEELVRWAIAEIGNQNAEIKVLDIGTGSGCIAIVLAKTFPEAKVYAMDVSQEALRVAKENARSNGVEVTFVHGDILNLNFEHQFDVIISNPPYVREMERVEIDKNVKEYEPSLALFVPDTDPLKFYRTISMFSRKRLLPNGKLFFEINQYLAKETQQLLVDNQFGEVELRKDIFGNFRMLKGKLSL